MALSENVGNSLPVFWSHLRCFSVWRSSGGRWRRNLSIVQLVSDEWAVKKWLKSCLVTHVWSSIEVMLTVHTEKAFVLSPSSSPLKPLDAGKSPAIPQHASLSLVKPQDYSMIHPTWEAEEDTWAGEATSKTLCGLGAVLPFMPRRGQTKFGMGWLVSRRALRVRAKTSGLVFCKAATAIFLSSLRVLKAADVCWKTVIDVVRLADGRLGLAPLVPLRSVECCWKKTEKQRGHN